MWAAELKPRDTHMDRGSTVGIGKKQTHGKADGGKKEAVAASKRQAD